MTKRALVVLSGGADSTICLAWAKKFYDEVHCITFDYGQNHADSEIEAAETVARLAGCGDNHTTRAIYDLLEASSDLTTGNVTEYMPGETPPAGVAKTFVPLRNQMLLTIAANHLYALGGGDLVTGVCQTDYSGYPDCRREFIDRLETAFNLGTFTGEDHLLPAMAIQTPLMFLTKAQSVKMAMELPLAYSLLAWSHTAYTGGLPTDTDAASLLRAKGFEEAGIPDPLVLRLALHDEVMELPATSNYSEELVAKYRKQALAFV